MGACVALPHPGLGPPRDKGSDANPKRNKETDASRKDRTPCQLRVPGSSECMKFPHAFQAALDDGKFAPFVQIDATAAGIPEDVIIKRRDTGENDYDFAFALVGLDTIDKPTIGGSWRGEAKLKRSGNVRKVAGTQFKILMAPMADHMSYEDRSSFIADGILQAMIYARQFCSKRTVTVFVELRSVKALAGIDKDVDRVLNDLNVHLPRYLHHMKVCVWLTGDESHKKQI